MPDSGNADACRLSGCPPRGQTSSLFTFRCRDRALERWLRQPLHTWQAHDLQLWWRSL